MVQETKGMKDFDHWVRDFVAHVSGKGVVPGTQQAEASAQTTTNQERAG